MKALQFIPLCCLIFFNCSAQNDTKPPKNNTLKPNENISVNKEYDEFGNLKRYDSIYSYSYSSNGKVNDRLMLNFQRHFNGHTLFEDSFFDDFFGKDSSAGGFYPDNFFQKGFMNQNKEIETIMRRMDSIQQLFFNQNRGMMIPPEPEKPEISKTIRRI